MADEPETKETTGKAKKKKQIIAISVGLGVLLAIFLFMRSKSSAASATTAQQAAPATQYPNGTGVVADPNVPSSDMGSAAMMQTLMQLAQSMNAGSTNNGSTQGTTQPGGPPAILPSAPIGGEGSYWWTADKADYPQDIVKSTYNPPPINGKPDLTSIAIDAAQIQRSNPQLNWGQQIPAGSVVYIPPAMGTPGQQQVLPPGATEATPLQYMNHWPTTWQTQPGITNSSI